jgi:hypothetical protein
VEEDMVESMVEVQDMELIVRNIHKRYQIFVSFENKIQILNKILGKK